MDDLILQQHMDQLEPTLVKILSLTPDARKKIIERVFTDFRAAEGKGMDEYVAMLAVYGLCHIMQIDKRRREDGTDRQT